MGLDVLAGRGAVVCIEDSVDNYCSAACAGILGRHSEHSDNGGVSLPEEVLCCSLFLG